MQLNLTIKQKKFLVKMVCKDETHLYTLYLPVYFKGIANSIP